MTTIEKSTKHYQKCERIVKSLSCCFKIPFTGLRVVREKDLHDLIGLAIFPEDDIKVERELRVVK